MMDELKKYLSDRLLSEELPVSYRLLSRALNLHVNQAKWALYEFYQYQNGLRANSIFATYMISGVKAPEIEPAIPSSTDDEGSEGDSPITTLTIVAEEKLEDVLAEYEQVDSIHVYSLAPQAPKDLTLLSDVARTASEYFARDDALKPEDRPNYGVILNPMARRGERKGAPIPAPSSARMPSTAKSVKAEPTSASPSSIPATSKAIQAVEKSESPPTLSQFVPAASARKKPAASSKRGQGGGIMSSFAKAAAKPKPAARKKEEKNEDDEDDAMVLSDDGEADDSDLLGASTKKASDDAALVSSRKQREAGLRRMMEESDDEGDDAAAPNDDEDEKGSADEDEAMEEAQEPEPEPEPEPAVEEKPSEIVSGSGQGRRRGKRRVIKKKRILDDKGYMVTMQEEGWESFSEDEAPPPAPKPVRAVPPPAAPKAKKQAKGSAGQGNIMSFFTKK